MNQQLAVMTQHESTNFNSLFVPSKEIDRCIQDIFQLIAQRAYELYESRGGEHGNDWEDWFQAESEVLQPVTFELDNPADAFIAVADISSYEPEDLRIALEPRSLTICGLSSAKDDETNCSQQGPRRFGHFYLFFELPSEIDPTAASADIKHDVLEISMPKVISQANT